ncbi:hypothetical protein SU32_15915 [Ahrensia marina]|uniref:Electron transport protein SCO1/SenC n=1 Tax=Ahrensia marina TaxID=1514904 RepID=A0A0N0VKY7_9HYPH|nr:hypothetical protein SU32_15915 [Ahrensia marina]
MVKTVGATIAILSATLALGWWQVDGPFEMRTEQNFRSSLSNMNFEMTSHLGKVVSPEYLVGNPTMFFFGFTYCPDVCPTTLAEISTWIEELGDLANSLNVVFITVDPARDDVKTVAEYLSNFNSKIEGWIGNSSQLAAAGNFFDVTYQRKESEDGTYTMDHSSSVFLYRSDGTFARTIDYHEPREVAVPKIKRTISEK